MAAGGWLGMTGLGPGLKSTGWPNASCTEPCVNTWRFGSTCEERSEAAGALVDAAFAGGAGGRGR